MSEVVAPQRNYRFELARLFLDAIPITLSFSFQQIMQASSILICGRLGTFELSVASFGYMFFSSTAVMTAQGVTTAIDTLGSHALGSFSGPHGDTRQYLGIVLQRGLILLTIIFLVLIIPLWWNSGALFVILGQKEDFASATQRFLIYLLPAAFLQLIAECLKKFLQVQDHRNAVAWSVAIGSLFTVLMNYALVIRAGLGLAGAAISHAFYYLSIIIAMLAYIVWTPSARQYWGGSSWKALQDTWPFVSLALSGLLAVATEFWCFQSIALMAATLDYASIGAQGIVMTSDLILATVPVGLSIATSHRIGKALGAGDEARVRLQLRVPFLLALCIGSFECILLLTARNMYGRAFSDDKRVVDTTAKILPLLAGFQYLDLSNNAAAGILRGAGKTHLAGGSNIVGYYGVGLVLAWSLCFKAKLGLVGLWIGVIAGCGAVLLVQTGWVLSMNWEKETAHVHAETVKRTTRGDVDETTPLIPEA